MWTIRPSTATCSSLFLLVWNPDSPVYPSYFKLHVRWLRSPTRITYLSKLIGMSSLAALRGS
ncbi:hypothetical protein B5S52_16580 [Pectobacterium brasiliense]|nr:hypothetical protein B5S52_16580 [Pectobacterium brasiliense]ATV43685.1 hypothetical protein CTV95_09530 [Pectobacterium brasiliense]